MPWVPASTDLGSTTEMGTFNYSIQYYDDQAGTVDPTTGLTGPDTYTYRAVTITPQQVDPSTVNITNGLSASISGYFGPCFNDTLTTRDHQGNITTINTLTSGESVFNAVNKNTLHEVIAYVPDPTRTRTFTFTATAYDPSNPNVIISTQIYVAQCKDLNWDTGRIALKELVSYASSN